MPADELADFGRLVETHYQAVVAVAYATTRDVALAQDIAQDTFVAAWASREKLRDAAKLRPWLCSIARNKSRNALRDRRREVAEEHDVADPKPSVVDGAVEREATAELHAALAEVPMTYREPLVLFYWEQKSIAQVASALAITEEAAQKRISRDRSYLRDGLEGPLEGESRGRRTAAAAAAAVLAILATQTGAAQAATAKQGANISMFKVVELVGLAGLIVGTVAVVRGGASDAASKDAASSATPAPTKVSASQPPPREPLLAAAEPDAPRVLEPGPMPVPDGYEITVRAPTFVTINLAGGRSETYPLDLPAAAAFERRISGRVVDGSGKPVRGAAVIVGTKLSAFLGSLSGSGGAMSSADGSFTLTTHEEAAGFAVALHPRGWSSVVAYPAGSVDPRLDLVAPGPGSLAIHVRQAGAPREAQAVLSPANEGLRLILATDKRGELSIPLLAPGAYRIETWPVHEFRAGASAASVSEVTVVADAATEVQVALPTGVLVMATAFKPGMFTVEYMLYAGTETLELAELKKRARAGTVLSYLLGGHDADHPAELHDVTPGIYTLCVDATTEDRTHYPFTCRALTVPADKPTLEVTVDVRAATSSTP